MAERRRILIVDDDAAVRFPIRRFLLGRGYEVEEADGVATGVESFRNRRADAAVIDYSLGDGDGLQLLRSLRGLDALLPVVLLTAHGSIDLAVQAVKEGAEQFFTKPVELATLEVVLARALETQRLRQVSAVGVSVRQRQAVDPFVGESPAIRRLAQLARRVATASLPVLIHGETGSGKGVLARWLHQNGPRREEPFVDLNCAGLSRELLESELFGHEKGAFTGAVAAKQGLFEMAHRGIVFLDEVGEIDVQVQPKLLKVLEELRFRRLGEVRDRQVDVRLVAATHRDLARQVDEGRFREDLLYRINTVPLAVPPLRDRENDVVILGRLIAARVGADVGRPGLRLSGAAERSLRAMAWPGNVRQLRNVLERAALLSERDALEPEDLGEPAGRRADTASDAPLSLLAAEKRHIEKILATEGGNVQRAADVLGLSRSALYDRIKKHGIVLATR